MTRRFLFFFFAPLQHAPRTLFCLLSAAARENITCIYRAMDMVGMRTTARTIARLLHIAEKTKECRIKLASSSCILFAP
jgi:hypothetical protein